MTELKRIIINKASQLRAQYNLGNYCGRNIFDIIEKLDIGGYNPILFRLPLSNDKLSGFIGYKNKNFGIFTNTSKPLGVEIFTAAHEIYHLVENCLSIKEKVIMEEMLSPDTDVALESQEMLADLFASELLMPESDIRGEYQRLLNLYRLSVPDETVIIMLQQLYFVEYKAITKRLLEVGIVNYNSKVENELNQITLDENAFSHLIMKLGVSNELQEPSRVKTYISKLYLRLIEENYKRMNTSYDDLTVLFSYAGASSEDFGYEQNEELTDSAKILNKKLSSRKEQSIGQK